MPSRSIVRSLSAVSVVLLGCANPVQRDAIGVEDTGAFVRSLAGRPAVFVLDRVEDQTTDAIVLFDHTCPSGRYQHVVRDTITLSPDGAARRAFTLERFQDGRLLESSHLAFSGRWTPNTRRDVYYYSDGPSVVMSLASEGPVPSSMQMWVRVGEAGVTSRMALGGSCQGSPNDGRHAEFTYSRR